MKAACAVSGMILHIVSNYISLIPINKPSSHFRLRDPSLQEALLPGRQACHEDRFRATTGGDTSAIRGSIEQRQDLRRLAIRSQQRRAVYRAQITYHSNHLGLHLANARENIRMNRVGNAKLAKGLCLQLQEVFATMIYRTAHTSIFPACMFQASQLGELLTNLIRRPAILRQCEIPSNIRTTLYKLRLEVLNSCRDLLIDLASDAGDAQEDRVKEEANSDVNVADASEKAVATKRIEGLARVAENEEYKYDVADAVVVPVSDDDRRFAGRSSLLTGPG